MKKRTVVMLVIFLLFIILRLVNINANPPSDLSPSAGIWVDEMHNVHQVRNRILFGSWKMDRYTSVAYSPIFAGLQYVILSVIGVGLWEIKMLPIGLSIFSLFLVYKSFKEYFGYRYGFVAAVLLGFNYTFIMYNRLGLYENLVIFFMLLTLFFWQRALKRGKVVDFFLTGVATVCVFAAKSMTFYFMAAMGLSALTYCFKKGVKSSRRQALFILLGVGAAGAIWYLGCFLPFKEGLSRLSSSWSREFLFTPGIMKRLIAPSPLFLRFRFLLPTLGIAIISWLVLAYKFLRKPRNVDLLEISLLFWFLGGTVFLGTLYYHPTRYYLPVLSPVALMAAIGLVRFGYKEKLNALKVPNWQFCVTSLVGTTMVLFYFLIPYIRKFKFRTAKLLLLEGLSRGGDFIAALLIGLFFVFCALVLFHRTKLKDKERVLSKRGRRMAVIAGLIFILLFNLSFYSKWVSRVDYSILKASRQIGEILPPGSLIVGQGVMAITIENRIRHVQAPNWYENARSIFYDYPITHLLLSHYAGYAKWYKRHYPLVMKYSKVIGKYRICNNNFYLFEINIPDEKKEEAYKCVVR